MSRLHDDRPAVRLERSYATDAADLWSALNDPVRLARWLTRVEGDLRPSGDGATVLSLDHRRLPDYTAAGYGAGWQAYLEQLDTEVGGRHMRSPGIHAGPFSYLPTAPSSTISSAAPDYVVSARWPTGRVPSRA
jgi:hypothetical protein